MRDFITELANRWVFQLSVECQFLFHYRLIKFFSFFVVGREPQFVCLALKSPPTINLLLNVLKKLIFASLCIWCLGGEHTDAKITSCFFCFMHKLTAWIFSVSYFSLSQWIRLCFITCSCWIFGMQSMTYLISSNPDIYWFLKCVSNIRHTSILCYVNSCRCCRSLFTFQSSILRSSANFQTSEVFQV